MGKSRAANPQEIFECLVDENGHSKFNAKDTMSVTEFLDKTLILMDKGFKLNAVPKKNQGITDVHASFFNFFAGEKITYTIDERSTEPPKGNIEGVTSSFNYLTVNVDERDMLHGLQKSLTKFIMEYDKDVKIFSFN
jgi:hypothetical protein